MKPVDQTQFSPPVADGKTFGNCVQACLASIFEVPLESVPHSPYLGGPEHYNWLLALGFGMYSTAVTTEWNGYHLIVGKGPRTQIRDGKECSVRHCCVGFNGRIVHDPHPSRAGLIEADQYFWFVALDPAKGIAA